MAQARYSLVVKEPGTTKPWRFRIAGSQRGGTQYLGVYPIARYGGRGFNVETKPWEPGDPVLQFRKALFPWHGGLASDRLSSNATHSKANADTSVRNLMFWPPKQTLLTLTNAVAPDQCRNFDGKFFINGGRYLYYIASDMSVVEDKDFGVGKACTCIEVLNGQLICAMGESEKLWARDAGNGPNPALWHQATDATYAVRIGAVGMLLWRTESTNKLSNASSAPLTLASWAPASAGNKYTVGDSTWSSTGLLDFGNVPYVAKATGLYSPDGLTHFQNQTPQIKDIPHADNGKGLFAAMGSLWYPTNQGLIKVEQGSALGRGPEKTELPDYRFWVRGGVEYAGAIYLLVTDEGGTSNTSILKMEPDPDRVSGRDYKFTQWQLPGTTKGYFIGVFPAATNPVLIAGYGNNAYYITLGRNGGRQQDDANWEYGANLSLETGNVAPSQDLTLTSVIRGVQVLADLSRDGDSLSLDLSCDDGAWVSLLSSQEGSGHRPIARTANYQSVMRYAPPGTECQFANVKFTGTTTSSGKGTDRAEIREAWLVGHVRPKQTDVINVALTISNRVRLTSGAYSNIGAQTAHDLFRKWQASSTPLEIEIDGYDELKTVRCLVVEVLLADADTQQGPGLQPLSTRQLDIKFARLDFDGSYGT